MHPDDDDLYDDDEFPDEPQATAYLARHADEELDSWAREDPPPIWPHKITWYTLRPQPRSEDHRNIIVDPEKWQELALKALDDEDEWNRWHAEAGYPYGDY